MECVWFYCANQIDKLLQKKKKVKRKCFIDVVWYFTSILSNSHTVLFADKINCMLNCAKRLYIFGSSGHIGFSYNMLSAIKTLNGLLLLVISLCFSFRFPSALRQTVIWWTRQDKYIEENGNDFLNLISYWQWPILV